MGKKKRVFKGIKNLDLKEVRAYIIANPTAKIYFGCDSTKFRKQGVWHARYVNAIVVYEKDNNKIFGEVSYERDYDANPGRPQMRMMQEVYKVSAMVVELQDVLKDREFEVHLDINPNIIHGSSCAISQAVGYIKGVNNITPKVKPDAWAASCVADHMLKR